MSRALGFAALSAALIAAILAGTAPAAVLRVGDGDLQDAIDAAAPGDTIRIGPGLHPARPVSFVDSLCGNCAEARTAVRASAGFRILGKGLVLIGAGPDRTTLTTGAGYGVYLEDADGSAMRDLAITGGRRDPDGRATDGAVVVRRGRVVLQGLHLRDNTDRPESVVVGIGGVIGREGAEILLRDCRIANNGWDGVALYRGAAAWVEDCVIEQGRGAGIGITWDAAAVVLRNRVSGYWKGIGAFGSSRAIVRNNAVFDNLGWGIIATGESYLEATHNVVVRNGNCGFAVWEPSARGIAANNIIADNGWREEWVCPRVGFWHGGRLADFPVRFNALSGNVEGPWRSDAGEPVPGSSLQVDPGFRGRDFRLPPGGPLADAGDSTRTDLDGSRSDPGLQGGPSGGPLLGAPPDSLPAEVLRAGSPAWDASGGR